MQNRLFRYETMLFRRSFADAFGRTSDRILLAVVLGIAVLAVPGWLEAVALPRWLMPVAAAMLAFGWQRAVRTRLSWLERESLFAAEALETRTRAKYAAAAHALLAIPSLGVAIATASAGPVATLLLTLLGYAAGIAAAFPRLPRFAERPVPAPALASSATGRRALFRAILARQTFGSAAPEAAALVLFAAVFLLTFGGALGLSAQSSPVASITICLPALACLLLLATRLDAQLLGFLPYAGHGPGFIALALCALPAGGFAAASAAIAIAAPERTMLLLPLFLLHLTVAIVSMFRAWLYPGRNPRSVDLQVQVEFAALLMIGWLVPPLALVALAWRTAKLASDHRSLRWVHP